MHGWECSWVEMLSNTQWKYFSSHTLKPQSQNNQTIFLLEVDVEHVSKKAGELKMQVFQINFPISNIDARKKLNIWAHA